MSPLRSIPIYLHSIDWSELTHTLEANASDIHAFGVERLGIFGSFARDAVTPQSDVDLMGLSRYLGERLGRKVELVTPGALNAFTASTSSKRCSMSPSLLDSMRHSAQGAIAGGAEERAPSD